MFLSANYICPLIESRSNHERQLRAYYSVFKHEVSFEAHRTSLNNELYKFEILQLIIQVYLTLSYVHVDDEYGPGLPYPGPAPAEDGPPKPGDRGLMGSLCTL